MEKKKINLTEKFLAAGKTNAVKDQSSVKEEFVQKIGLNILKTPVGAHKGKRVLGRGSSSGHGKTSTRGSKGQTSRAGRDTYMGFEGGQSPLIRRFPKRGFTNSFKKVFQIVNLESLKKIKDEIVTPEILEKKGLIKNKDKRVKILGIGEVSRAFTIQAHAFSVKAQEKIKSAGGKFEVLNV